MIWIDLLGLSSPPAEPAVSISADTLDESFRETIEIGVDVTHPILVTSTIFPASTVVMRLAEHGEAIRERATLRATVRTMGAVEMSLRNRKSDERQTRIEIERHLALVQEELTQSRMSHSQDQEDFKKLKDFLTSQFGYRPIDMLLHDLQGAVREASELRPETENLLHMGRRPDLRVVGVRKKTNADANTGSFTKYNGNRNDANPLKEVVLPFDEPVVMEVKSLFVDQTITVKSGRESYPPLPTQGTTPSGNTPGKLSHATVIGESSRKALNFHTLYTLGEENEIDVVMPVESIRAVSDRFENSAYGFFLGQRVTYPVVANYVKNTWGKFGLVRSMFSSSTGLFTFQFRLHDGLNAMLENGPWFIRTHLIILKKWNPNVNLLKEDVGNVPVWVKLHGVPVTAFSEDGLSAIATKLDGYQCGTSNLDKNWANSSGSSFWNVENSSNSTTPVMDKIGKFKNLVIDAQAILMDEAGNPQKKVEYSGDHDSDDEVASVANDMACDLDLERTGFGTQSFLEQWRDSYGNGDYDEDMYDDDMYKGQDLSEEIQTICDKLDLRVRGRKKQ
nr:hypothetical protein [Tanacetum cinerariifolium]